MGLGYTGDADRAEELVQEVFARAIPALRHFRGEAAFGTWLYRIALTTLWRGRRSTEPSERLEHRPAPGAPPDARAESGERDARVRAALGRLSPEHRAVLTLFAVEGLSHAEVAALLGVELGTAWSRYARARVALARELAEAGVDA